MVWSLKKAVWHLWHLGGDDMRDMNGANHVEQVWWICTNWIFQSSQTTKAKHDLIDDVAA